MHLQEVNQTYLEHLLDTLHYAWMSFTAGTIFIIHGLFPNTLITSGSYIIGHLHHKIEEKNENWKIPLIIIIYMENNDNLTAMIKIFCVFRCS